MLRSTRAIVQYAVAKHNGTISQHNAEQCGCLILIHLSSFGRYGIPLNIVYGPDALDGITLPELLTKESVFAAIETADLKPNSGK